MNSIPRYLITTAEESTWVFDQPVLFLGPWCLLEQRSHVWSKMDYEVVPYHWDNPNIMEKDSVEINSAYEKLLISIAQALNKTHGINWTNRAWRIVVGPWLHRYVEIMYDRWSSIKYVISNYELTGISIDHSFDEKLVAKDIDGFSDLVKIDIWNYNVYSKFIVEYYSGKLNLKKIAETCKENTGTDGDIYSKKTIDPSFSGFILSILKKIVYGQISTFISRWISKRNKYYIYNTYIKGRINVLKLHLSLRQWPILFIKHPLLDLNAIKLSRKDRNNLKFDCIIDTEFEELILNLMPRHLPVVYYEGFKTLLRCVKYSKLPKHIKTIVTTIGIWKEEVFKVWVAQQVQTGTSLIVGQHGGEYGTCLFSVFEEHELKISDMYLSWGWKNELYRVEPSVMPMLFNNKKAKYNKDGRIVVVCNVIGRYLSQMHPSMMFGSKGDDYLSQLQQFIDTLPAKIHQQLSIKLFPDDDGWARPIGYTLKKNYPNLHYLPLNSSLSKLLDDSKLSVHTYNGTTFLEEIAIGRPCILLFDPRIIPLRKSAQPFFDKLQSVGICHYTPESAANKIDEISDCVDVWWNYSDVLEARKIFCKEFAFTTDDQIKHLRDIILHDEPHKTLQI